MMYYICRHCGKIVEDAESKYRYYITEKRVYLRKYKVLDIEVSCSECGEVNTHRFVVKKKSKRVYTLMDHRVYLNIPSADPKDMEDYLFVPPTIDRMNES